MFHNKCIVIYDFEGFCNIIRSISRRGYVLCYMVLCNIVGGYLTYSKSSRMGKRLYVLCYRTFVKGTYLVI